MPMTLGDNASALASARLRSPESRETALGPRKTIIGVEKKAVGLAQLANGARRHHIGLSSLLPRPARGCRLRMYQRHRRAGKEAASIVDHRRTPCAPCFSQPLH